MIQTREPVDPSKATVKVILLFALVLCGAALYDYSGYKLYLVHTLELPTIGCSQ